MFTFLAFMCILAQFLASAGDWFLTYWVNKQNITEVAKETPLNPLNASFDDVNIRNRRDIKEDWDNFWMKVNEIWEIIVNDQYFDVYLFTAITVLTVLVTLARSVMFFNVSS